MESIKSDASFKFGTVNNPNASDVSREKANASSPVKGEVVNMQPFDNGEGDREYTDRRTATISLVKNYSLYRKANDKVLPKRKDYIGSSVVSSRTLSSNKDEVEAYFPNIVGVMPNNESFLTRVKQYLNNIRIPVDELGRTFDISFYYNHKRDYDRIKLEENKIEVKYQATNRQDITALKAALKEKITELNILESTKFKVGRPLNVEDYLMYRHCLLYKDVAKDVALINADSSIRFYFKDDQKEAERLKKYRMEVNKAKANYVACLADDVLFDAVYTQYCVLMNLPILSSLAEDRLEREIKLDKFSTNEPVKFNKIYGNKDIKLMATIEQLIARGELTRSQYNQNIVSAEGEFIGANIGEAVAYFKNPENTSIVNAYFNKLKNV